MHAEIRKYLKRLSITSEDWSKVFEPDNTFVKMARYCASLGEDVMSEAPPPPPPTSRLPARP